MRLTGISSFSLPAPSSIAEALVHNSGPLARSALVTAREIVTGFVASGAIGIALALVLARFAWFGRAATPLVVLFQNVPKVALAPLFVLWFGYGLAAKVSLISVIAFFPVTLSLLAGIEAADPGLVALVRSVGARRGEILWRIELPGALPQLMAGLKIALTLSVVGAIVGEFAGASAGLGYDIQFASNNLDTPAVFAALIAVSLLGLFCYYVMEAAERLCVPWAPRHAHA